MNTFKYKRLGALLGFIHFFAIVLVLYSCSSTPTILEKEIKIPIETTIHDTVLLRDTVISKDTLWAGEVTDSLNNVIGWLKVFYNKKIAELKISKKDTAVIIDTVFIPKDKNMIPAVVSSLTWWEQLILYGGMASIITLLIALRFKRGKV